MNENKQSFVYRENMTADKDYVSWLSEVKTRFVAAQTKASVKVNSELLGFYWSLGRDIATMNMEETYGKGIMSNISKDLQDLFPDQKGFSVVNLHYMKRWYLFYLPESENIYQAGKLFEMPDSPQKRYVVVELKAVGFKPEFAGKINFYVSAADELLKGDGDNDSIGLIICKEADRTIVEWSFRGVDRPLGVATYQLQEVVDRTFAEIENRKNSDSTNRK